LRQRSHVDILCLVNNDTAIIIEDKVGTTEHSNQLERYKDVEKECKKEEYLKKGFHLCNSIFVYLQTGNQSSYAEPNKAGYCVYTRQDLLRVLESPNGKAGCEKNTILYDFRANLQNIEHEFQSFTGPLKDWSWGAWEGFYTKLQESLGYGNWAYVANPAGGFLGFYWHEGDEQYLQLEQEKFKVGRLCFKIWVKNQDDRLGLRKKWHKRIINASISSNLKIIAPKRFGYGEYMTVALLEGEYRVKNSDDLLDFDKTLLVLKSAEAILNTAVKGTE
jgi:hypothetical protein